MASVIAITQTDPIHKPLPGSFDADYLGGGHGGNPISWTTNTFDKIALRVDGKERSLSVPLIQCCGIGIVKSLKIGFHPPLKHRGQIRFTKRPFYTPKAGDPHGNVVVPVAAGTAEVDLMGHRSLFVAYKDCRTDPLRIDFVLHEEDWAQLDFSARLECIDNGFDPKTPPEHPLLKFLASGGVVFS